MEESGGAEEVSIESEFAEMLRYIDLYLRQKTDLFLQHYLFEPFDHLKQQMMILSVLIILLMAGTLIVLLGVIFFISTLVPLWTALLIVGGMAFLLAGGIAYRLFSDKPVLKTPTAAEVRERGRS